MNIAKSPMPDGFKPCGIHGLWVNREGRFWHNGKPKTVIKRRYLNGRQQTAYLIVHENRQRIYLPAMPLVAKALLHDFRDGMCVVPKDGSLHNLRVENLLIVREEQYLKWIGARARKTLPTLEDNKLKMDCLIREAQMVRRYMDTRDFTEITAYLRSVLIPVLIGFMRDVLGFGEAKMRIGLSETVFLLYEKVSCGYTLYSLTDFSKSLLRKWKQTGELGKPYYVNKNLFENHIEQLKLDSLCEKFRK